MSQQFPLSYSRIDCYNKCPRNFDYQNVSKVITFKETEATKNGKIIHKELEEYCKNEITEDKLTIAKPYTHIADKIKSLAGNKYYEQQLAFNQKYEATEYYSKTNILNRSIIDILIINEEKQTAQILDWKTGKRRLESQLELEIFALTVFINYPTIQKIKTTLIWLKEDKRDSQIYYRSQFQELQATYEKHKTKIYSDLESGSFKAKPSPLCNWCGALDFCDRK